MKTDHNELFDRAEQKQYSFIFEPKLLHELSEEDVHREWIWEGYIAKGCLTMFSAIFKAGKSTLLRTFLAAMQSEKEFIGMPTTKCNVLVITEEGTTDWAIKRDVFGLTEDTNIFLISRPFNSKPTYADWQKFIELTVQHCKHNNIDLVIFDTLPSFWPVNNENDASECLRALVPLNILLRENIATLFFWHFNKQGGDEGTAARGSSFISGFADCLIEFSRTEKDNLKGKRRKLRSIGRLTDEPIDLVIEYQDDNTYEVIGTPSEVSKAARIQVVKNIFIENPSLSFCCLDIHTAFKLKAPIAPETSTLNNYLRELLECGFICIGDEKIHGKRKVPYYKLKEVSSIAHGTNLSSDNNSTKSSDERSERVLSIKQDVITIDYEYGIEELIEGEIPELK